MNDRESLCGFIRDEMLTLPQVNAEYIWKLYKRSLTDDHLYSLMNQWMKEPYYKMNILLKIVFYDMELYES